MLAAFLVLAGATGSILAFHHEIDAALTPEWHNLDPQPRRASLDAIAARIEARDRDRVVGYFVWAANPSAALRAVMNTRAAAEAGRLDREAALQNEVYADPYSGRLLGERNWGEIGASRAHLVPMVYRLHMSLFMGSAGQWILGIVAAAWIAMLLAGLVLAVPRLALLRQGLAVKWHAGRARLLFDLHRSFGLAGALVLVVIAFTGLYMNLPSVMEPALAAVAPFTERPPSVREAGAPRERVWRAGWDEALAAARRVEPDLPVAVMGRVESRGYYQVRFLKPGDIMDAGTLRIFVDGRDASVLGSFDDRAGTVGDQVRIWQFPLHSGQGFGMTGRVLVCVAGTLPPLLAVTGLWLWLRRRRRRREIALAH